MATPNTATLQRLMAGAGGVDPAFRAQIEDYIMQHGYMRLIELTQSCAQTAVLRMTAHISNAAMSALNASTFEQPTPPAAGPGNAGGLSGGSGYYGGGVYATGGGGAGNDGGRGESIVHGGGNAGAGSVRPQAAPKPPARKARPKKKARRAAPARPTPAAGPETLPDTEASGPVEG